jgi:hypothetical protein
LYKQRRFNEVLIFGSIFNSKDKNADFKSLTQLGTLFNRFDQESVNYRLVFRFEPGGNHSDITEFAVTLAKVPYDVKFSSGVREYMIPVALTKDIHTYATTPSLKVPESGTARSFATISHHFLCDGLCRVSAIVCHCL